MFQQIVGSIDVCGTDTNVVHVKVGPYSRCSDRNVEYRQHHRRFVDMPTVGEELGLYVTRNLR